MTSAGLGPLVQTRAADTLPRLARSAWPAAGIGAASVVFAYLVASGLWFVAAGLLLALPAFVLIHRRPMIGIALWLLVSPLVSITESAGIRTVYWLVHRGLPIGVLAAVLVSSRLGIHPRKLPRLGWPEVLMAAYVGATLVSIAYTSPDPVTGATIAYDRAVIPMCLYLIVRLVQPDGDALKAMVPAVLILLLSQGAIALLSWTAPGALPAEWLGKLEERTTGSLRNADLFGVTVLFCGMFLLHMGLNVRQFVIGRQASVLLFALSVALVFFTFSRATWLAGIVALLGLLRLHPRFTVRFAAIMIVVGGSLYASGALDSHLEFARTRFLSEESRQSALSRLPVAYAAIRMFQEKPLSGWGYENFDRLDYRYQGRVANLFAPVEDHSSHNLYLTVLAEQGLVGFVLFLGPAVVWLLRTRAVWARVPPTGLVSRKLLGILWLFLATHVVINNFVRMQVPFGFGMWWLTLGLIGSIVAQYGREPEAEE